MAAANANASANMLALQLSCRGNAAREQLLRDWVSFSESRGELSRLQNLPKTPKGVALDWLRLYEEVVARGGFTHVSAQRLWPVVLGRGVLNLDILPYQLAAYYERYWFAFEQKQLFGRDVPTPEDPATFAKHKRSTEETEQEEEEEPLATGGEVQDAPNAGGTPLPRAPKRLKTDRLLRHDADFGSMHGLVLALDSGIPAEQQRAINLLTILSFGDPHDTTPDMSTANENELLVDNVPGLLDALYRQLQQCALLPHQVANDAQIEAETARERARRRMLNLSREFGQRALLDARGLQLLNVVRNLSMVGENEKPLADHDELCVFLIMALRCFDRNVEIGDHVLDTLCNVSKRIDFLSLHPPAALEVWHPHYQLAAQLWKKEKVLPLECLLQQLNRMLVGPARPRRSVVLRACELLCNVCRDIGVKHALSTSSALQDPALLDRVVALLAATRQDFAPRAKKQVRPPQLNHHHHQPYQQQQQQHYVDEDYDMDDPDDEEDESDTTDAEENSRWPAPWENDGLPSGVGMGVVYVTPEGNRHVQSDDDDKLDHEIRDAALEVLFRLSDCDDAAKVSLGTG